MNWVGWVLLVGNAISCSLIGASRRPLPVSYALLIVALVVVTVLEVMTVGAA